MFRFEFSLMRKLIFCILLLFAAANPSFAAHLKGGWIQYAYLAPGSTANTSRYQVTVRQYLACNSTSAQRDADVYLGIFNNSNNQLLRTVTITRTGTETPDKKSFSACLTPAIPVCYIIDVYSAEIELPDNAAGYTLTVQRCCRITGIQNLQTPSDDYGVSYTTSIPGSIGGTNFSHNASPEFVQRDTVIVCYNSPFVLDFGATDSDGDSLSYAFCTGLTGGFNNRNNPSDPNAARPNPPSNPPYTPVTYSGSYSGSSPMGSQVTINQQTGLITGIAPGITGDYVMSVCVSEWRNGVLINTTKKEIHVTVGNCTVSAASLKPTYVTCNGTTLSFENQSTSSSITSYLWDFGVPGITTDTSTSPTPTYDYLKSGKDSGTFTLKLKVATSGGCEDSTTAVVKVYPGFKTGFTVTGACVLKDYLFSDTSTIKYGTITSRLWDFGDPGTIADTAHAKDTAWKYASAGLVTQRLIIGNSVGCIDTISKPFTVLDKPSLSLPFRDTLICSIDTLMLRSNVGTGSVTWKVAGTGPNASRIQNANTATPLVWPTDTTKYYVTINDNGCNNTDSVTVNVLQFISVDAGLDTNICQTDTFHLRPTSYALQYLWSASSGEIVQNIKSPLVQPLVNTKYIVIANLGKCQAKDSVNVTVSPYPMVNAGPDVTICYGQRTTFNAVTNGSTFTWAPTSSLIKENTLNPVAGPTKTTTYILTVTNATGCLKEKKDTIVVTVTPTVPANAGRDTSVVAGQPLQLQASGGDSYVWTPSTWLDNPLVFNPVATLDATVDSIIYTVRASVGACYADDQVKVRVFKTGPDILVPSGFTPNGDGKNDVLRPYLMGISKLNYFSIYNRWGQLLFTTTEENKAWDGTFNGLPQPSGAYVYQASGVDYLGKVVFRKGTVVLIR